MLFIEYNLIKWYYKMTNSIQLSKNIMIKAFSYIWHRRLKHCRSQMITSRNDSIWSDSGSVFVTSNSVRLRFDFLPDRFGSIWVFADLKSQNRELHLEIRSLYICLYACLVRSMHARWKNFFFAEIIELDRSI
jgi:hypothetical protein